MGQKILIDEVEYDMDALPSATKEMVASLQFVTKKLEELSNLSALLQRAKLSYIDSLKKEMISDKSGLRFDDDF